MYCQIENKNIKTSVKVDLVKDALIGQPNTKQNQGTK